MRPYASEELDDAQDVLIGHLSVIVGVVDGGYHQASYSASWSSAPCPV